MCIISDIQLVLIIQGTVFPIHFTNRQSSHWQIHNHEICFPLHISSWPSLTKLFSKCLFSLLFHNRSFSAYFIYLVHCYTFVLILLASCFTLQFICFTLSVCHLGSFCFFPFNHEDAEESYMHLGWYLSFWCK